MIYFNINLFNSLVFKYWKFLYKWEYELSKFQTKPLRQLEMIATTSSRLKSGQGMLLSDP
jgi:hypothetical protein